MVSNNAFIYFFWLFYNNNHNYNFLIDETLCKQFLNKLNEELDEIIQRGNPIIHGKSQSYQLKEKHLKKFREISGLAYILENEITQMEEFRNNGFIFF